MTHILTWEKEESGSSFWVQGVADVVQWLSLSDNILKSDISDEIS